MRILRWFGLLLAAVVLILVLTAIVARVSDGPIGAFAGGPLVSGEHMTRGLSDWSTFRGVDAMDMQLVEPPRSRRVWLIVDDDGNLYIPSGFVSSLPFWKHWPPEAVKDGRAVIRIEGQIYPVTLVKIDNPPLALKLANRLTAKYDLPASDGPPDPEELWIFRVDARSDAP